MSTSRRQIFVDQATGEIEGVQTAFYGDDLGGVDVDLSVPTDIEIVTEYYWKDALLTLRPDMPCSLDKTDVTADGIDVVTLTNVPTGAEIFSDEVLLGESDGTDVEISYDLAGTYPLKVVLFPYLDFEEAISAT